MPIINDNINDNIEPYFVSSSRYGFEFYNNYSSYNTGTYNTGTSIGTYTDSLREFTWYNVGFSEFYRDTNIVDNMVSKKRKVLCMEIE